jgi:S-adenosylmethionine hydrolase
MPVVTITTDLGVRDFYLAALKGSIVSASPEVTLIDISTGIKQYDIKEGSFVFKNAFHHFPAGTIHVIHVNSTDGNNRLLLSVVNGHYILCFDNGLLSLAFGKTPDETYEVNEELKQGDNSSLHKTIARAVEMLVKEYKPNDFCHPATNTRSYRMLQPMPNAGSLKGSVIYIDSFGNAVVNITEKEFRDYVKDKRFSVQAKLGHTTHISNLYSDVEEGDFLCLFNSSGYMEVAINKGKADSLLGLKVDSLVLVMLD